MIWYFVALLIYIVYVMIIVWITQKEGFMKSYSITKRALSMIRKLNLNTDDHVSPTNRMVRAYVYGFDENVSTRNRLQSASVDVELESASNVESSKEKIEE